MKNPDRKALLIFIMDPTTQIQRNRVNGCSSTAGAASRGRSPVAKSELDRAGIGPHPNTGQNRRSANRQKFSRIDNIKIMECYYGNNPSVRGYIKRMAILWQERGNGMALTEQRLADQAQVIISNRWFNKEELEEIESRIKHKEIEEQIAISDSEHEIETETSGVGVGQPGVGRAEIDIEEVTNDFEMLTTEQKETVLRIRSMREELEFKREPIQSLRNIPTKEVKKELKN